MISQEQAGMTHFMLVAGIEAIGKLKPHGSFMPLYIAGAAEALKYAMGGESEVLKEMLAYCDEQVKKLETGGSHETP